MKCDAPVRRHRPERRIRGAHDLALSARRRSSRGRTSAGLGSGDLAQRGLRNWHSMELLKGLLCGRIGLPTRARGVGITSCIVDLERFTDRARSVVVVLAQEEARRLHHNEVGTEHILLGLIHEGEGVAANALESLGISLEAVRGQVEEIIGQGGASPSAHEGFTPRADKVLELSRREALQLAHNYVGTEHLLLGLIRAGEGVAAQVLVKLGADLSSVRVHVIRALPANSSRSQRAAAARGVTIEAVQFGEEMRTTTLDALVACWDGDDESLTGLLRSLVQPATLANDGQQLGALRHLVDIRDAECGDIQLKPRPADQTP